MIQKAEQQRKHPSNGISNKDVSRTEMRFLIAEMLDVALRQLIKSGVGGRDDRRGTSLDLVYDATEKNQGFRTYFVQGSFPGVNVSGTVSIFFRSGCWFPLQARIEVSWPTTTREYLFTFEENPTDIRVSGRREV